MQNSATQVSFFADKQAKKEIGGDIQFISNVDAPLTRRDIQRFIKETQVQRAEYEKENGVLLSEERRNALYD